MLLQSRSSAVPSLPNTEEYWSRIPHRTPTSWFSACWQASASSRGPMLKPPPAWNMSAAATSSDAEEESPPPMGTVACATASTPPGAYPRAASTRETPLTYLSHVGDGRGGLLPEHVVGPFLDVHGPDPGAGGAAGPEGDPGVEVDGHGHDVAEMVVRVRAQELRPSRRPDPAGRLGAVQRSEPLEHGVPARCSRVGSGSPAAHLLAPAAGPLSRFFPLLISATAAAMYSIASSVSRGWMGRERNLSCAASATGHSPS